MNVDVLAPEGSFTLLVAGTALALLVSFFCSLMEAALLSITPGQLARLKREKPRLGSTMSDLKDDMDRSITAILALNTTAHTIGATIAGAEFALMFGDKAIGLFSGVFTYLMLQYTEVLPKSLGVRFNRVICAWMALPLSVLTRVMGPLIRLLRLLNRPFESRADTSVTSLEEVVALAKHARLVHQITREQENIITQAAYLSEKAASEIMVPVEQITFLSSHQTLSIAIVTAHMDPHTRFPVIKNGDRDHVQGYINFKELVYRVRTNPAEPTLQGVIRPVHFVQADIPCQQILRVFVEAHEHMAIVRDTQDRTIGLITLEDVVEVLLGDLYDEFDHLPKMCHALPKGVWIVGGGVQMSELAEQLGLPMISTEGTLSDWMMDRLGEPLVVDQRLSVENLEFTIRRIRRSKAFEVLISPVSLPPVS